MSWESLETHDFQQASFGEYLRDRMLAYRVDEESIHRQVRMTRKVLRALLEDRDGDLPTTIEQQIRQLAPLLRMKEERLLALYTYFQRRRTDREHRARRRESIRDIGSVMWLWGGGLAVAALVLLGLVAWLPQEPPLDPAPAVVSLPESAELGPEDRQIARLYHELELGRTARDSGSMQVRIQAPEDTWIHVVVDDYSEHWELIRAGDDRQWRAREVVRIRSGLEDRLQVYRDGLLLDSRPDVEGTMEVRAGGPGLEPNRGGIDDGSD